MADLLQLNEFPWVFVIFCTIGFTIAYRCVGRWWQR